MTRAHGALVVALVALAALVALVALVLRPGAVAQAAEGRVTGIVRSGTAGMAVPAELQVELLAVPASGQPTRQVTTIDAAGRFAFTTDANAAITYLLRATVGGVDYFAPPLLLSSDLPTAEAEITVYGATTQAPVLRVTSTVVTVIALDRVAGQLTLVREDTVVNPGDRAYTGDDDGVTLRLPLPNEVVAADGDIVESTIGLPSLGSMAVAGDRLAMQGPLKPGWTAVVTRYVVGYDRARGEYRLTVAASLPTDRMELRVPVRFVAGVRPLAGTREGGSANVRQEQVLVLVRAESASPDAGVAADLLGLDGPLPGNPLAERGGAVLGVTLVLAALAGAFAGSRWLARRRAGGVA